MDTIYEGKEVTVGFAEQTAFGTAVGDASSFTMINSEDITIDRDVKRHEITGSHGVKNPTHNNIVLNAQGSMASFPVNGPLSVFEFDQYAYAFFQNVTEGGGSPYTKTFDFFGVNPDFPSPTNAGHFLTWILKYPEASTSWKMNSAIVRRLKISGERNGMILFETDWVSKGTPNVTSNPTGTWTANSDKANYYGIKFFNDMTAADITFSEMAASPFNMILQSFEIECQHEIEAVGQDGSGGFLSYGIFNRTGNISLTLMKDAAVEEALTNATSNEDILTQLRWGTAGAPANLNLDILARGKIDNIAINKEGILGATITASMSADVGDDILKIYLANNIDRLW